MNVINIKLADIKPYEKNPRKNDMTVKYLKESIKQFGFQVPLVIDKDYVIVTGHTRYKAATELGLEEVPCLIADDLNEKQIKAFRIVDNKVAEIAQWNDEELRDDIVSLMENFDMTDFGFGNFELSMLLEDMVAEDYDKDLIAEYSSQSDAFLTNSKLIIVYDERLEDNVKKLIKEGGHLKVVYRIEDIEERFQ